MRIVPSVNEFDQQLGEELTNISAAGLRRELRRVDSAQGRMLTQAGACLLNFSSNDYLGLANHDRLKEAAIAALKKFGAREDGYINMTLSRQDLASYTGTTYETAFRIMSELIQEDIIAISGKSIAVKDPARLQILEAEAG